MDGSTQWRFLRATLQDFGFPTITTKLVMHCVNRAFLSYEMATSCPFFLYRLRQSDHYLFMLCMKKTDRLLNDCLVFFQEIGLPLPKILFDNDFLVKA